MAAQGGIIAPSWREIDSKMDNGNFPSCSKGRNKETTVQGGGKEEEEEEGKNKSLKWSLEPRLCPRGLGPGPGHRLPQQPASLRALSALGSAFASPFSHLVPSSWLVCSGKREFGKEGGKERRRRGGRAVSVRDL